MTLLDGLLVLAATVVVPLAIPLVAPRTAVRLWVAVGALTLPSLLLERGHAAAVLLAVPWLAVAAATALGTARRWVRDGRRWTLDALVSPVTFGYLAGAAGSLVASRSGFTFRHLVEPIVQLTAIHYSYAAFVAPVLAHRLRRHLDGHPASTVALILLLVAPPIVAAGFVTRWAVFQVGGAVLLFVATWTLAALTLTRAPHHPLLVVSSLAVLAPMVLAVSWAAGQFWAVPALGIPDMARTHGVLNALGFSLCGVLGWRAVAARS